MKNQSVEKWLYDYNAGKEVKSVEMGGIAKEYEEAIQDLSVEILKEMVETESSLDELNKISDRAVSRLSDIHGFSGAQVGAAKNLCAVFWKNGVPTALDMMFKQEPNRIIKIKKGITKALVVGSQR